jgi:hypothetical protein
VARVAELAGWRAQVRVREAQHDPHWLLDGVGEGEPLNDAPFMMP